MTTKDPQTALAAVLNHAIQDFLEYRRDITPQQVLNALEDAKSDAPTIHKGAME